MNDETQMDDACLLLDAYLDDELADDECKRFEEHLTGCENCRQQCELQRNIDQWLIEGNQLILPSAELTEKVRSGRTVTPLASSRSNNSVFIAALACAAIVLLVIGAGLMARRDREYGTAHQQTIEDQTTADRIASDEHGNSIVSRSQPNEQPEVSLTAGDGFLAAPQASEESGFVLYWILPDSSTQSTDRDGTSLPSSMKQKVTVQTIASVSTET